MKTPKLPTKIWSAIGDVTVRPLGDKPDRIGEFDAETRTIEVKETLDPDMQILVLWHEIIHLALYDSGAANVLKGKNGHKMKEEAVCDAVAHHLTGMMRAGQLAFKTPRKR